MIHYIQLNVMEYWDLFPKSDGYIEVQFTSDITEPEYEGAYLFYSGFDFDHELIREDWMSEEQYRVLYDILDKSVERYASEYIFEKFRKII